MRRLPASLALLTLWALTCPSVPAQTDEPAPLFAFDKGAAGWRVLQNGALSENPATVGAPEAGRSGLALDSQLPEPTGAGVAIPEGQAAWHSHTHLRLSTYLPADAPPDVQAIVYLKDGQLSYYQHLRKGPLPPGEWTRIDLDLTADSVDWQPEGHFKPWDGYCREDVREFGVKFIGRQPYGGRIYVSDVAARRDPGALPDENTIYNLRTNRSEVPRYGKFEASFNLARTYDNPFDPDQVDVQGRFIRPDGSAVSVPGFFYQGFLRRKADGLETLVPMGRSQWKVRFAPRQLGTYHWCVEVRDGETVRSTMASFRCVEGTGHGFVRVSRKDPDFLEFDDGEFFYPIGHNIAAVHDERAGALGVNLPAGEGTYAYDRFLKRMGDAGENFGRVWMTPWSFGIEWTKAYSVQYRGLGRYNLQNAWRLDHVVESARGNGVYLMLLFTSHGEIGDLESDFRGGKGGEAQGSPYWERCGGPLKSPLELYTNAEAQRYYLRKVRYICARWGYATSIMAWEVFNEADLAFFRMPDANQWGLRSARFLKRVLQYVAESDPAGHLRTSCFWQHGAEYARATLSLEEMDIFAGHIFDEQLSTRLATDRQFIEDQFGKILFVTEAGLTPFPDDVDYLARTIKRTLWTSYMVPMAGAACPWWWVVIDRRDLYPHFAALAAFAKGEDRRGQAYRQAPIQLADIGGKRRLTGHCLMNDRRAFCWAYDEASFAKQQRWLQDPPTGATVSLAGLATGPYRVEVWDTKAGRVMGTLGAACVDGRIVFELPPFSDDVACKVIAVEGE